jgi:hypothetical protein
MRLRMAPHAGEVHQDDHGVTSSAIVHAFRLVDAEPLRAALVASPGVLALITSDWFFDDVVRHSSGAAPDTFRPVTVVRKETTTVAWIALPDFRYPPRAAQLPLVPSSVAWVVPPAVTSAPDSSRDSAYTPVIANTSVNTAVSVVEANTAAPHVHGRHRTGRSGPGVGFQDGGFAEPGTRCGPGPACARAAFRAAPRLRRVLPNGGRGVVVALSGPPQPDTT